MDNFLYWVWLSSLPGIGAIKANKLLDFLKDPYAIWNITEQGLRTFDFMTPDNINTVLNNNHKNEAKKLLQKINNDNIHIIPIVNPAYPEYLKNIYDPPIVLYKKGDLSKNDKLIAIVGSRRATKYGLDIANNVAFELAKLGITIVSGMASGIDTLAHKGALKAGGRTIAILGCGVDIVYPYENKKLMEEIISSGAVVSEYLPGTAPKPRNFPARNRIISGISLGTVVVEANKTSGSLITANFALEQGREVFAIPGNISSANSTGTNKLIKDGAKMVTCIDDILEEIREIKELQKMQGKNDSNSKKEAYQQITISEYFKNLDSNEIRVLEYLNIESLHIDLLAQKCNLNIQTINSILVMLELKGIIEQLPGKIFKIRNML